MAKKFFCYVDETGQDTRGELFVVSVVIADQERDRFLQVCEAIEQETGKGRVKWIKITYGRRIDYIRRVLDTPIFQGKLSFAVYRNTQDYASLTVLTIVRAFQATGETDYKATILIDGLPHTRERAMANQLRQHGVHTKKVRGVKKDENDALIRLADAVCGFIRAAIEGQPAMVKLFERGMQTGVLRDLSEK